MKLHSRFLKVLVLALTILLVQQTNGQPPKKGTVKPKSSTTGKSPVTDSTQNKAGDSDGDGIIDANDKCPEEKGVEQFDGCPMPDSDNDGIADDLDECPTVSGLIKYKGCPVPDTDGDKISDEEDACPTVAGYARYKGCDVPDTDADGVNDDDDKCPNVVGSSKNFGCPETKESKKALRNESRKKKE